MKLVTAASTKKCEPETITLNMSAQAARVLAVVLAHVSGSIEAGHARNYTAQITEALRDVGIEYEDIMLRGMYPVHGRVRVQGSIDLRGTL